MPRTPTASDQRSDMRRTGRESEDWSESLHTAVYEENMRVMCEFLDAGQDPSALDGWGVCSLHYAVLRNRADLLQVLLEHGGKVDTRDSKEYKTPLHWAAELGHVECMQVLKDAGADLSERVRGFTPLHLGVMSDKPQVVRWLLSQAVPAEEKTLEGLSTLQLAVKFYRHTMVRMLVENGADVNCSTGETPLYRAVALGAILLVRELLYAGADPNRYSNNLTPVHLAAQNGFVSCLEYLRLWGGNLLARTTDHLASLPLHLAAEKGKTTATEFLLMAGSPLLSCNSLGLTALHLAAARGQAGVVQLLTRYMSVHLRSTTTGSTPLHLAVLSHSNLTIQLLLCRGARLFERDIYGNTALHGAAMSGNMRFLMMTHVQVDIWDYLLGIGTDSLLMSASKNNRVEVVQWLLDEGVPCDLRDQAGRTALHHAARQGHVEVVQFLLDRGARANILDHSGKYPLNYAVLLKRNRVIQLLTSYVPGSSSAQPVPCIEYIPDGLESPIHMAALRGDQRELEELLNQGGDVNSKNGTGMTPLMLAVIRDHADAVTFLLSKGADPNAQLDRVDNRTALHYAALRPTSSCMRLLLNSGAVVDPVIEPSMRTPLFWAVCAGRLDSVKILVEFGADYSLHDSNNNTVVDIARHKMDSDMINFFNNLLRLTNN